MEVIADAQALQTESAAVDKLITRDQIDSLELNGRDPLFLASLQPGVRSGTTLGDFTFSLTNGGYAINGARSQDTTITFDGAPAVRTRANGTSIGVADVDSTQEVQVLTADYGAEYGRASGGQIRIVTKGGGAQFHGAAYEYFRNSDLNANTWSRNLSTDHEFRVAVPLQPVRLQHRRSGDHSPRHSQRQDVLLLRRGMGALSQRADPDGGSSHRC